MRNLTLQVALVHAGRRVDLDARELEARLAAPGLAGSLLQVFVRSLGDTGGSKNLPSSPVTLNAYSKHSGYSEGSTGIAGNQRAEPTTTAVDNLASHLADALADPKSVNWYRKVAREVPHHIILAALGRARDLRRADVRRSRAALFTSLIRSYLKSHESYAHPTSSPT